MKPPKTLKRNWRRGKIEIMVGAAAVVASGLPTWGAADPGRRSCIALVAVGRLKTVHVDLDRKWEQDESQRRLIR